MARSGWRWLAAALLLALGLPAAAAEVPVSTREELAAALEGAGPGTVIALAPGDYGALEIGDAGGAPDAPLTLRSADPARPARLSRLQARGVRHLRLEGLLFDYAFAPGDVPHLRPFVVEGGRDVTITGATFDGDRARGMDPGADGYGTAFGLGVRNVEGFALRDSTIRTFLRGLVVSESVDVTVTGNVVTDMRSDGMDFAEVSRVLIEGNRLHDFARPPDSGDHPDMIQFWTNRTATPTTHVTIRGNLLSAGAGPHTQSIFMRNEEVDTGRRTFEEMAYRDVRIENNVILNAHAHGITVGEADGLVIANNSVLRNAAAAGPEPDRPLWVPRIRVSPRSRDVEVVRNLVSAIDGYEGQGGWRVADNLLVQDRSPSSPGFYGTLFAGMPRGDPRDPRSFAPRPGGPLDGTGLGSTLLDRLGGR